MITLLLGAALLIAFSGDGLFNGGDLLAWLLIGAGLYRNTRRPKGS